MLPITATTATGFIILVCADFPESCLPQPVFDLLTLSNCILVSCSQMRWHVGGNDDAARLQQIPEFLENQNGFLPELHDVNRIDLVKRAEVGVQHIRRAQ
jgi:hypothetical protein